MSKEKVSIWKKWLSHLTPVLIQESGSERNPELEVLLSQGRYQLISGNAIYSWDDLYHNFRKAFEQLQLNNKNYEEVLLLGLGLASVPYMLEKTFHQKYAYTAVELDEEISQLASKYTLPRLDSSIEIITADAEVFIELCESEYDMVIMDIFEDDKTPPQFESEDFLGYCNDVLKPGGLLLYNRLTNKEEELQATQLFFDEVFSVKLPGAFKIETGGNWILCFEKPHS